MIEEKTPIRVTGCVKWFNQFKGYGFVEVENISEDVFLHFLVVDKSGLGHLNNNDVILCDIIKSDNGYQVKDIIELLRSNKYEVDEGEPTRTAAVMKWFNPSKGFGFAQLDSGEDVFIHSSLLKKHKLATIEPGREIELMIHRTNFGYEAIEMII
ncbi:MAG: cold shock domain-containing protein [Holosporaceae bacterium]|jgi:CspA family cold shock protein|nr:cold shock domain-containing protein [Holosporaceae bacterium]